MLNSIQYEWEHMIWKVEEENGVKKQERQDGSEVKRKAKKNESRRFCQTKWSYF